MNDADVARKPKGWPLFAIALLVALLAGFLFLRWRKREEAPSTVKQPVPIAAPPSAEVGKNPPAEPPAKPVAPPSGDEFGRKVAEVRKAIDSKNWDQASTSLEAARKLKPDDPALAPLETEVAEGKKKDEAERAEALKVAEEKQARDRDWTIEKPKIEECKTNNFWDEGLSRLEDIAKKHPSIVRDTEYEVMLKNVTDYQKESDVLFKRDLAEAQKLFADGKYVQSIAKAESALAYYPERKPQVREFQDRARDLQMEKSMVRIPSQLCWIGSEDREDEKPLRQVKLPPFLMDRYLVTNEEYAAFTAATGYLPPPHWGGRKPPKNRERHPVTFVTWEDAREFAKWAGKRLPTAEEWEVAARGPDKREFPWGNAFQDKEDQYFANCLEHWQLNKSLAPGTTPVDQKEFDAGVSFFGVYGMSGNVWEWTSTSAPATGEKPPPEFRILKGGSFMTPQRALRCANVFADDPRLPHPDVGFRCARDVK
jgi:formylglycine-generating enzyme required for sulfatase activity